MGPHTTLGAGRARGPVGLELERWGRDWRSRTGERNDDRDHCHDGWKDEESHAYDLAMLQSRLIVLSLELGDALVVDDALIDEGEGRRCLGWPAGSAVAFGHWRGVGIRVVVSSRHAVHLIMAALVLLVVVLPLAHELHQFHV